MFARSLSLRAVVAPAIKRTFVTRSTIRMGAAAGGDHGEHDAHAPHPMFDQIPFNKGSIARWLGGMVVGGVGLICFAVGFQNKKHGFPQEK